MDLKHLRDELEVAPGKKARLAKRGPDETFGLDKDAAEEPLRETIARMFDLQALLAAENRHALLIVLQGMDASGKDGTIRHVMTGLNPQGCRVTSFKAPNPVELAHDFLWRVHRNVPARGEIGIFNRSHYEDVLIARVHDLVPKSTWSKRYDQINDFERLLAENGVTLVKFFLHISKDEQKDRFAERLEDPQKNWKIVPEDLSERERWDDYVDAYEDALSKCSTEHAPWYVVPANHKWFRNLAVAKILVEAMESLRMSFPEPADDLPKLRKLLRKS